MTHRMLSRGLAFFVIFTVGLAGCGSDESGPLAGAPFAGTWIEEAEVSSAGVTMLQEGKQKFFKLDINADNSFTWTMVNAEGEPVDPPQNASGTWKLLEGKGVEFSIDNNSIGDERFTELDVPWRTISIRLPETGADKKEISLRLSSGLRVELIPADAS